MFRVDFIDDYTTLKPLIDYKELSELITANESALDPAIVRQFRERYARDPEGKAPPEEDGGEEAGNSREVPQLPSTKND